MTTRSGIALFEGKLNGNRYIGDISKRCWPSWRRETLAEGGQHQASFAFSAADNVLESWLAYIGYHVEEIDAAQTVFEGLIYTMRLRYHGVAYVISLDDMYNSVAVSYETSAGAGKSPTTVATNAASIARYGTKELRVELNDPVSATAADAYRDALLTQLAWPRVRLESVAAGSGAASLSVTVKGYVHTLDWRHYDNAFSGDIDLDQAITDALASADYVTSTSVAANTLQVARTSDYRPVWQRIKALAAMGDASGNFYNYGVYGTTFKYEQATTNSIAYDMAVKSPARQVIDPSTRSAVRPAQVLPGGVLYVSDVRPALPPDSTLLDDPRSMQIAGVRYDRGGVTLRGASRSVQNNAQYLLRDELQAKVELASQKNGFATSAQRLASKR